MVITAIEKKRVSDEVFEQMKNNIVSGEWAPGARIPGELDLVELFGVSRVSVREAIHRLVGMGVLTIRRGEGTFVSEILPSDYFDTLLPMMMIERPNLIEMLEFRNIIEVESAKLAAKRAEEKDIGRMAGIIKKMENSQGDRELFSAQDLNFHYAMAIATHNNVIIKVNAILSDMLKKSMDEIVGLTGYEGGIYYHKKILDAIKNKDSELSALLMKEHINTTMDKVKKGDKGKDK
ncbi:MAG: FadR family transcriptional regulator [Clostridiaceae bacterium]|jgi:GntR family transcriptional repressor for pyruvate dehydrogenase complex|nr:FadR family transcriptional regulator [Clostridiaceae bacterium]